MSRFRDASGRYWISSAPLLSVLLCAPAFAQAPSASSSAMTNADVVKMANLGFGNDVIDAKISHANAVDFHLEVDDLSKLKAPGVSQDVITIMLKRSSGAGSSMSGRGLGPGARSTGMSPSGAPGMADARVKLSANDHDDVILQSVAGTMSTTFAYVTTLIYANFPGLKADAHIQDNRPVFFVRSAQSPRGRVYLVSAEVDSTNNVRSVKMGNSHMFGAKNIGAPDPDNQIDCDAVAVEGTDTWRLTPKKDLKPGEYGLWMSMQEMYDFRVDP
jgi:hypothetical protein